MKNYKQHYFQRSLFILLVLLLILIVSFFSSGCEVFKTRKESRQDSTSVRRYNLEQKDSSNGGSVKKEEGKSKEESEWWRVIQQFQRPPGDTNVTNITNNYPQQPATIIYEGGKGSREESHTNTDSSFYMNAMSVIASNLDSMNRKIENIDKTKHVETKGIGLLTIVIIGLGCVFLFKLLGFISSKYSITKK